MKDYQIRALKTFVQAFGGVLIPQLCAALSGTLPENLEGWSLVLVPALCAAIAAGISAAWNVLLEVLKDE